MKYVVGLILAMSLVGCMGLGKDNDATMAQESALLKSGIGGLAGYRATVYAFARTNCVNCHGTTQVPKFAAADITKAYDEAIQLVNFVQIPASKFVSKVKDGHCGGACTTDGSKMVALITQWKAAYSSGDATPGEVVPIGNIFTNKLPVPSPNPMGCNLPDDLAGSPDVAGQNKCWTKMRYPFTMMTPGPASALARGWFEVDMAFENYASELGPASYVVRNPRIISPDVPIFVHDIKIFINGNYHPEYGEAYRQVDTVVDVAKFGTGCTVPAAPTPFAPGSIGANCVPAVQALFSTAASASGITQESADPANPDTISFSFEYLNQGIVGDCQNLSMFDTNVYTPIKRGAVFCLDCHKAGGTIPEAGQRFNMDPDDLANGATAQDRLATVCRRFLQRSNFALPDNSPIIVQPRQGLNGMPAQPNFSFFAPDWIAWINEEARLAK